MPPPDADLHPVATGLAKETVDKHAADQPLKLFAGWFCPFVQRVWLALEEKGIPYQYIEVNPYHKGEQLMKANPRGLVPTLEVAPGKALYESTVLLQYLDEAYPDHAPQLLPATTGGDGKNEDGLFQRARARIWMDFVTSRIIPAWHRLLQFQPSSAGGQEEGRKRLEELRDEYRGFLLEFARAMDPEGPYFFAGDDGQFGMVDLALAPWVLRHWVFEHFKGITAVPEPGQSSSSSGGKKDDDEAAWGEVPQVAGRGGEPGQRQADGEREGALSAHLPALC
ncbi:glutathione-S-transferase theta- GST [Apiospora rasikravindrae]|uniref:Glutathione-S-transferase theta- GST n=1 Tax=Apiospora rasikravindrae TaxID=990691 RepID=A0ABR1U9P4_9PEZI